MIPPDEYVADLCRDNGWDFKHLSAIPGEREQLRVRMGPDVEITTYGEDCFVEMAEILVALSQNGEDE